MEGQQTANPMYERDKGLFSSLVGQLTRDQLLALVNAMGDAHVSGALSVLLLTQQLKGRIDEGEVFACWLGTVRMLCRMYEFYGIKRDDVPDFARKVVESAHQKGARDPIGDELMNRPSQLDFPEEFLTLRC